MRFSDLSKITKGKIAISEDCYLHHFSTDTRILLGKGDEVFVAINANRDGHQFISETIKLGIKNFITEQEIPFSEGINVFQVKNSIHAFQDIAAHHRSQFELPIIGITGSNGKTTVKEWLSTILSEKYFVVKNPKSYNSQIGVPLSILGIGKNHEIGVFEAGISQTNEMANLEKIIKPSLGIFTTLGQAHDECFESTEQKLEEKLKLFEYAEKVIFRSDAAYSANIDAILKSQKITWALDGSGEINVQWDSGAIFIDEDKFRTKFSNAIELENVTQAIIAAQVSGLSKEQIQKGLDLLNSVPMRLEFKKGINDCYVLDDTYNNDVAGLKVALDYLESHQENEKRTLILSDILQSGVPDDKLYEEVNQLIIKKGISRLIGVGPKISMASGSFEMDVLSFSSTDELLTNLPSFHSEMILIKGARDFELERLSKLLEEQIHGTVLEVNFEALQHNLNQYRNLLQPSTKIMVMVKANAYGSGILEIANFLQHQRVDQLGVAYVDEAISLRQNGIFLPILIMNPLIDSFSQFEKFNLQAEIFSFGHLERLLKDTKREVRIQIKMDTGMHRLGFDVSELNKLIQIIKKNSRLKVAGIFTHFSSSDDTKQDQFTVKQAALFGEAYTKIADSLGYQPTKHACNSSATVRWPQYHYDMVRLGIGLHGFDPARQLKLKTTSKLKTVISQIQTLRKGETVGYARKGVLDRDSKIAVLPVGYEDGYFRAFGNRNANVLIDKKWCPLVGNVCMDMIMVDVTDTKAKEGDEAIIFGENPTIKDLAKWANTIPYEILTSVSSRVKRVFVWE